ncbi:MAG: xylulokinase [Cognatishimia sp.]|nr:xylulokinase [Cognatishimia sp.]
MYLGLDIGTSGLRALLTDPEGKVLNSAEASYENPHTHAGWSEQNPADWIAACETAIAEIKSRNGVALAALKGIGLSGQMHGATLIDRDGQVLRPCILWNDTRSASEAAALDAMPEMRATTGNIVFPGFTAPKLMWVAKHEPEVFAKVAKVLLPKDYLRLWLTGDTVADLSDAAGTSWLDTGKRDWSGDALASSGLSADHMPSLVEGSEVSGMLRETLAASWGIKAPVVVAGGAADNAAAACGAGCFAEGQGFVSLGTSGVLLAAKDSYAPAPETAVHTFCHAVPVRWYQMGVILSATDSLNWLARNLGQTPGDLARALPEQISGPNRTMFLPYLSGERTPHNNAALRGSFVGLDIASDPKALTAAVMEGVAYALRDNLEALKATGTELSPVLALGGGARSRYWLETIATLFDMPLQLPADGEFGAAMGAVRLAMAAAEEASLEEIMTQPEIAETIEPRADLTSAYEAGYQRYAALAPALIADAERVGA